MGEDAPAVDDSSRAGERHRQTLLAVHGHALEVDLARGEEEQLAGRLVLLKGPASGIPLREPDLIRRRDMAGEDVLAEADGEEERLLLLGLLLLVARQNKAHRAGMSYLGLESSLPIMEEVC